MTSESDVRGRCRTFGVVPLGLGSRVPKNDELRRALFRVDKPSEEDRSWVVDEAAAAVEEEEEEEEF